MSWREIVEAFSNFGADGLERTGLLLFLIALVLSVLSSLFVSYLYVVFYKSRASGSQIHRAFPLLGLSVTAIFITIQFSLPLSLGLLGALSIVRFRTPIKEPEEISFLMLVIASALCCATFNILFLALVLASSVLALLVMRSLRGMGAHPVGHGLMVVQLPAQDYRDHGAQLLALLAAELEGGRLESLTEGEQTSIGYRFEALAIERVGELQQRVRALTPGATTNLYLDGGPVA